MVGLTLVLGTILEKGRSVVSGKLPGTVGLYTVCLNYSDLESGGGRGHTSVSKYDFSKVTRERGFGSINR